MSKRSDKKKAEELANSITEQAPISRNDIENKFREIKTEVDTVTTGAKDKAIPAAVAGGLLIMIIFFLLGKRVGKKKSAVVQIRRI